MGKKKEICWFGDWGFVGARQAGLSISKTADLLGFSRTTISRVYREWSEKERIASERQLCGRKCLVDVRGQRRMGKLVRDDRKATETQITTRYNQGMQNTISEHTTCRTLKRMGYSSRRPHRVPLLSAKNRKRRLQFAQAHQNRTIDDWKNVNWSDESRFLLRHSDGRVRIWRKEHESMDPSWRVSTFQADGGGVKAKVYFTLYVYTRNSVEWAWREFRHQNSMRVLYVHPRTCMSLHCHCRAILDITHRMQAVNAILHPPQRKDAYSTCIYALIWMKIVHSCGDEERQRGD